MRLIVEIKTDGDTNGMATGTAELFAEGCKTDSEKALAQLLSSNIITVLDIARNLTENLFIPPEGCKVDVTPAKPDATAGEDAQ